MTERSVRTRRGPDRKLWFVVAQAYDMASAEIPAGLLRTADIPVYLFREAAGTAIPVAVGMLGGVDVAVPEDYYAEALALLDDEDEAHDAVPPPQITSSADDEGYERNDG